MSLSEFCSVLRLFYNWSVLGIFQEFFGFVGWFKNQLVLLCLLKFCVLLFVDIGVSVVFFLCLIYLRFLFCGGFLCFFLYAFYIVYVSMCMLLPVLKLVLGFTPLF